jgi:hypothetical protein
MPEINITVREPNTEGVEELLDDLRALGSQPRYSAPGYPLGPKGRQRPRRDLLAEEHCGS